VTAKEHLNAIEYILKLPPQILSSIFWWTNKQTLVRSLCYYYLIQIMFVLKGNALV